MIDRKTFNCGDLAALNALLGHTPRSYESFAKETAEAWRKQ